MSKISLKTTGNDNRRKVRPTVQLYRPGMLRAAMNNGDSKAVANENIPSVGTDVKSPESRGEIGCSKEIGDRQRSSKRRVRSKGFISDTLWQECDDDERGYILNNDDYANLNRVHGIRRRNSHGSSNSGTCKAERNTSDSSRKSSINRSFDRHVDDFGTLEKESGRKIYTGSHYVRLNVYRFSSIFGEGVQQNSSQSLCENLATQKRDYRNSGPTNSRFGNKISIRNDNRTWDKISAHRDKNSSNKWDERCPSNRYQQHQLRQYNKYGDKDMKQNPIKYRTRPPVDVSIELRDLLLHVRKKRKLLKKEEQRCSVRITCSEHNAGPACIESSGSCRAVKYSLHLDRQRNRSFRSNQSERFDFHRFQNMKGNNGNCGSYLLQNSTQDLEQKDNATRISGTSSKHMSFQDLCASLDSIDLSSFDWSSEVEAEVRRKKEREEQERKKTEQQPSRTNSSNLRKVRSFRSDFKSSSKSCTGDRQMFSNCITNFKGCELDFPRHCNDRCTSQTSSAVESFGEQNVVECGSGEKTPTKNERAGTTDSTIPEVKFEEENCYLDEDLPIIIRDRSQQSSASNCDTSCCFREDFGRSKYGNRWSARSRKPLKSREQGGTVETIESETVTLQKACNADNNDSDLSSTTTSIGSTTVFDVTTKASDDSKTDISVVLKGSRQEHFSISSSTDIFNESSLKEVGKNIRFRQDLPPTAWPIHLEISNKQGLQIQLLNKTIDQLIDRITESGDPSAGEEILAASESLSKLYLSIVTRDIDYTYAMNLEQHLWKQCFHTAIEALRVAANSTESASRLFRSCLSRLVHQGLGFYALLLNKYEVAFGFVIDDYLYWQKGLPTDDFAGCARIGCGAHEPNDRVVKVALLSAQRLAVSVGDLHRYNAMVLGNKDYTQSKLWYHKAAQLSAGNGRSYNQLALLALYTDETNGKSKSNMFVHKLSFLDIQFPIQPNMCSELQKSKWIDVIFYYVRALSARYPFETARQSLFTAFNHVQKKVSEFEEEFNAWMGDSVKREAEAAAARADRPHEIWIAQDGKLSSGDYASFSDHRAIHMLNTVSSVQLFRRTVPYVLHTAGLLITKIGMEEYESISERALFQLSELISRSECPLSSLHLLQLSTLFLYAVHSLSLKNTEPDTCSLQQQLAVQMVLSVFGVLLKPIHDQLTDLPNILDGSISVSPKMRRVLPAVFVISEWLSMPSANRMYGTMPSLDSIETSLIHVDTWKLLADVANALVSAESKGILSRALAHCDANSEEHTEIVLPESVCLASFIDIFMVQPKSLRMSLLANIDLCSNSQLLALHARLSSLLSTAEYLDGSELPCFGFDENLRRFAANHSASPAVVQNSKILKYEVDSSHEYDNREVGSEATEQYLGYMSDAQQHYRQAVRENQIKQELLERETKGNRVVVEVRPQYLVPDTNTFIDHLESIKRIVESRRFTVLVPTIVLSELKGLSQPGTSSKFVVGVQDDSQESWVSERAKEADSYLHDVADKRMPQIYTVTSKGNRLPTLSFAAEEICASKEEKTVNDDYILSSCVELSATLPIPSSAVQPTTGSVVDKEQPPRLHRSVVLLTEDRALNIKAVCANIPCRTVPSFIKWAALN